MERAEATESVILRKAYGDSVRFSFDGDCPTPEADLWAASRVAAVDEPELERKVRVSGWSGHADGALRVQLCRSTWQGARRFQNALANRRESDALQIAEWESAVGRGKVSVPGIGVTHNIVFTSDELLVVGRRSTKSLFSPGRWSVSFEEQMRAEDLETPGGPRTTVLRGLEEEFGVPSDSRPLTRVQFLGILLERSLLNIALVFAVFIPQTFQEFEAAWQKYSSACAEPEVEELYAISLSDSANLGRLSQELGCLHPTSEQRIELLLDWLADQ